MSDEIPAFLPPPPPGGGPWRHHPRRMFETDGRPMIVPESWSLYIGAGNVAVRREGDDLFDVEVWDLSIGGHRRYHVPGSEVAATLRECCQKVGGEALAALWPAPPAEGGEPSPEIPAGPERIVAAAMEKDGLILHAPPPARHHSLFALLKGAPDPFLWDWPQGFVTSTGRFVDRREAVRIVLASGQPLRVHEPGYRGLPPLAERGEDGELYSEDLW